MPASRPVMALHTNPAVVARRLLDRHRRLLAALVAAGAMACALAAVRPEATQTDLVLAAARDLAAGPLRPSDLRPVALPRAAVPDGALRPGAQVRGRVLTGPVRRGEPVTDARLLGPGLVGGHDLVAAPVRLADAESARLVVAGDRVDVLAAPPSDGVSADGLGSGQATTVVAAAAVLAVPAPSHATISSESALVVLATTSEQAARLAYAQARARLSIAIRARG